MNYREWWIEFYGNPMVDDNECYKRYVSGKPFNPISPSEEVIHVIEKRAYDDVVRAHDEQVDLLKDFQGLFKETETKIAEANMKNHKLVWALKHYAARMDDGGTARKILKEVGELDG